MIAMSRIGRRAVLKGGIAFGIGLSLDAPAGAQDDRASLRPQEGDFLIKVSDSSLKPLTPEDIPRDAAQVMAWAARRRHRRVR